LKKEKPALEITQVFPEEGNLSLVLPSYLTKWTTKKLTSEGILVKAKSEVVNITRSENDAAVDLLLKNGEILQADLVILSTGLSPNVSLARRSNLEIDPKLNGIVGKIRHHHDLCFGWASYNKPLISCK
jgi:programmed cell death 8 (apoptosis-inducing factor)